MSSREDLIEQIDAAIRTNHTQLDMGKAIDRLHKNPDFITVILKGYLEQEAIRLVHLRTDPAVQTASQQADILRQIDGVAAFKDFLRTKLMLADKAAGAIEEAEDLREELLREDLEE